MAGPMLDNPYMVFHL